MSVLTGNILLGLVFGVVDPEANDPDERIVMGARAFITIKQIDTWLSELLPAVRMYIEDSYLEAVNIEGEFPLDGRKKQRLSAIAEAKSKGLSGQAALEYVDGRMRELKTKAFS